MMKYQDHSLPCTFKVDAESMNTLRQDHMKKESLNMIHLERRYGYPKYEYTMQLVNLADYSLPCLDLPFMGDFRMYLEASQDIIDEIRDQRLYLKQVLFWPIIHIPYPVDEKKVQAILERNYLNDNSYSNLEKVMKP